MGQAKRLAAEAKCKGTKAVKENIMGLIKTIETTLNCQGMCQETTFWWNKDITVSAPEQGCLIGIKNEFKGSSGAAAIVMIVAIVISLPGRVLLRLHLHQERRSLRPN